MPWKVNGQRWHLSDKGFPLGKKLQWDRASLPRLLDLVREVEPSVEVGWDSPRRHHAPGAGDHPSLGPVADQGQLWAWIAASWARRANST